MLSSAAGCLEEAGFLPVGASLECPALGHEQEAPGTTAEAEPIMTPS